MESLGLVQKSFWEGRKVILTGHTGFKGSWFLTWLTELKAEVLGISLPPNENVQIFHNIFENVHKRITHVNCDIRERKKLEKLIDDFQPEIIFHFAAQPLVRRSYKIPYETWETNLMGTINLLNSLKKIKKKCAVVIITTDKVYKNKEWKYSYRENDELGGYDPYSASKAAVEIAVHSWKNSFYKVSYENQDPKFIATARAGNVIGGGDWSEDRIIPDAMRALFNNEKITIRNPSSSRPWQHVLEPLFGYLVLAENLFQHGKYTKGYNFGPEVASNKTVINLVEKIVEKWPHGGGWVVEKKLDSLHEASLLNLSIEKVYKELGWRPIWDYDKTIETTVSWYYDFYLGKKAYELCLRDINNYSLDRNL